MSVIFFTIQIQEENENSMKEKMKKLKTVNKWNKNTQQQTQIRKCTIIVCIIVINPSHVKFGILFSNVLSWSDSKRRSFCEKNQENFVDCLKI
jgi:hypothetical protein